MPKALHLTPGRIAVVVTVCAVVAGVALTGGGMFSPGKLNTQPRSSAGLGGVRSHAELGGKCSACHAPPWSGPTMADRCMACHTDVRGQIDAHQTLHGRLANNTQCRNCHTEHKGEHAALTDLGAFDHNCAAFALTGKHTTVECKSCHTSGTYKGTPASCVGCHAEPKAHLGQFGTDCAKCHATATWRTASFAATAGVGGSAFDHSRTAFPLTGHHTSVDCKKCHVDNRFKGTPTSCVSCHVEPKVHLGKFGTDCKKCHATETWKLASLPTGGPGAAFDHSHTAFPLTGHHTSVDCKKCHVDNKFKGTPTTCVSCHAEPKVHAGSKLGNDCNKCHTTTAWTGATLGDFKHTFPIHHGRKNRGNSLCTTCHAAADAYKTHTCYGCHEHNPAKVARQHKNVANIDNCVTCHRGGRKKGVAAAELPGDELFASCPAGGSVSDDAGVRCPHDASLLLTFHANTGSDDRLDELLGRLARTVGRQPVGRPTFGGGAHPVFASRPKFDHATIATRSTDRPQEQPLVSSADTGRFDRLTDPFSKFRESRSRPGAAGFRLSGKERALAIGGVAPGREAGQRDALPPWRSGGCGQTPRLRTGSRGRTGRRPVDPDDAELQFVEALCHRDAGSTGRAAECLRGPLAGADGPHFASVEAGLRKFLRASGTGRAWVALRHRHPGRRLGVSEVAASGSPAPRRPTRRRAVGFSTRMRHRPGRRTRWRRV